MLILFLKQHESWSVLILVISRFLWINMYITPIGNESSIAAEVRQVAMDGMTSSHFLLHYFIHTRKALFRGEDVCPPGKGSPSYSLLLSLRIIHLYWTKTTTLLSLCYISAGFLWSSIFIRATYFGYLFPETWYKSCRLGRTTLQKHTSESQRDKKTQTRGNRITVQQLQEKHAA